MVAVMYILLPFHAWEECRIPGGFSYQYHWVMDQLRPTRSLPDGPIDRYDHDIHYYCGMV